MIDPVVLCAPALRPGSVNFSIRQIYLVSDKDEWESLDIIWTSVLNEAITPLVESIKTLAICEIVGESTAICATIESESE